MNTASSDEVTIVTATGEIDRANVAEIVHRARVAARGQPRVVVLDLSAVTFIDLGALRALHALRTMWRDGDRPALTIVTSPAIRRTNCRIRSRSDPVQTLRRRAS